MLVTRPDAVFGNHLRHMGCHEAPLASLGAGDKLTGRNPQGGRGHFVGGLETVVICCMSGRCRASPPHRLLPHPSGQSGPRIIDLRVSFAG
jgi:hypothetical protein